MQQNRPNTFSHTNVHPPTCFCMLCVVMEQYNISPSPPPQSPRRLNAPAGSPGRPRSGGQGVKPCHRTSCRGSTVGLPETSLSRMPNICATEEAPGYRCVFKSCDCLIYTVLSILSYVYFLGEGCGVEELLHAMCPGPSLFCVCVLGWCIYLFWFLIVHNRAIRHVSSY